MKSDEKEVLSAIIYAFSIGFFLVLATTGSCHSTASAQQVECTTVCNEYGVCWTWCD